MSKKPLSKSPKKLPGKTIGPPHPWRLCPLGQHWVRKHERHVPPSKNNPAGYITKVESTCRDNPSQKDSLYSFELKRIAENHFPRFGSTIKNDLGYPNGNKYNELIQGWTKYWNEVLSPKDPLDPDLIKALIGSESGFDPKASPPKGGPDAAQGLMQITNNTRKFLADDKGEVKDFLVKIDKKDVTDPNLNIAAGVRWLFRKKEIADSKAGKATSWRQAVVEYKSYQKDPNGTQMKKFDDLYKRLKGK